MSIKMYEITREDLKKVVDHKLFQEGLQFCIEDTFISHSPEFNGDIVIKNLAQKLEHIPISERIKYLKTYP